MFVTKHYSLFAVIFRHICLYSAVLLTAGCTIQLTCDLYNNTNFEITIIQNKSDGNVSNIKVAANASSQLSGWSFLDYEIMHGDDVWKYEIPSIRSSYVSYEGFGPWKKRIFKAQIEADGRIFILGVDQNAPLTDIPEQPLEFPLSPL